MRYWRAPSSASASVSAQYAQHTIHERWAAQIRDLDADVWWQRDRPHLPQWAQRLREQPVGQVTHWLFALGLLDEPFNILGDPMLAMWGPIAANTWWGIPFFAITLLAALQAIPRDLYEAASIDGANAFQRFRSITLPFLAPTIAITILLRTVWISNFADLIIVMTNGGPADRTQIVASYIFTQAFRRLDFGYASAIALVLLLLLMAYSLLIVLLRQTMLRKA